MHPILEQHFTEKQYKTICRYWSVINSLTTKLANFNYSDYRYYSETSDDEDCIRECLEYNKIRTKYLDNLDGKLQYFENEYAKYLHSIGVKQNDQTQDDVLFHFINNGITFPDDYTS